MVVVSLFCCATFGRVAIDNHYFTFVLTLHVLLLVFVASWSCHTLTEEVEEYDTEKEMASISK